LDPDPNPDPELFTDADPQLQIIPVPDPQPGSVPTFLPREECPPRDPACVFSKFFRGKPVIFSKVPHLHAVCTDEFILTGNYRFFVGRVRIRSFLNIRDLFQNGPVPPTMTLHM
jgi:hypothetical protein